MSFRHVRMESSRIRRVWSDAAMSFSRAWILLRTSVRFVSSFSLADEFSLS